MVKTARSGYTYFRMISSPSGEMKLPFRVNSLIRKKKFQQNRVKPIIQKHFSHFIITTKTARKDVPFIKSSWLSLNRNMSKRIDS